MKTKRNRGEVTPLTEEQQQLVLSQPALVDAVLARPDSFKLVEVLGRNEARSVGRLALCQAAQRYDPARAKFVTFAWLHIQHCLWEAVRNAIHPLRTFATQTLPRDGRLPTCPYIDRGPERVDLADLLSCLPARWRRVLEARYLESRTLAEIGEEIGVKAERVRQICEKALARIRERCPDLVD